MIKVEIARRSYVLGYGWRIDDRAAHTKRLAMMRDGWNICEEYVDETFNRLYVLADDEAAAALFKLTYL